jgi:multisubunit Na+/H+ antiporter MnhB subunit
MTIVQLFDALLAVLLLWLAWRAVTDAVLFRAVVSFVALGLVLALTWFRLAAPDLALAEAAVGSGLTGALMLAALRRRSDRSPPTPEGPVHGAALRRLPGWFLAIIIFGALAWALHSLPIPAQGLADEVFASLEKSGVTNPVTAVLLNYRSYDTLLELGVLLLAVVAVWSLRVAPRLRPGSARGPLLEGLLRFLIPLLIVTGGYLLWIGAFAPGGAFQGGALLGGACVLILLGGLTVAPTTGRIALLRTGLWVGLAVFIAVGLGVMTPDRLFLEYPVERAKLLILVIETAALISIGLTLGCLFYGGRPESGPGDRNLP